MKQLTSILLSILLLASTSGVSYAQHFCGDFEMMAVVTLGEEELSCGMSMKTDSCGDEDTEEHSCCDNQYTKVTTDDNFNASEYELQLSSNFIVAFTSVFVVQSQEIASLEVVNYKEYDPPPLIKNLPVLYETFLI